MGTDGDAVFPLKYEDPSKGGTEDDMMPTTVQPWEDKIACRGLWAQRPSPDTTIRKEAGVSQDGSGRLTFEDTENTTKTLTDLVAGAGGLTEEAHKVLKQLIHFIDDGPAEGFASGAYREVTNPGPFPTAIIWWETSGKLKKIVSLDLTWSGVNVTQEEWKVYDTDGTTALATITDAISYTGIFETSRTRTITLPP